MTGLLEKAVKIRRFDTLFGDVYESDTGSFVTYESVVLAVQKLKEDFYVLLGSLSSQIEGSSDEEGYFRALADVKEFTKKIDSVMFGGEK